ncbi:MAG: M28 family peptidase [Thermodesulfobacteriota bacterium]
MKLLDSQKIYRQQIDPTVQYAAETISAGYLKEIVNRIAIPRHYIAEASNNRHVRDLIFKELESFGYAVFLQGIYDNVVAYPRSLKAKEPVILIGAHYDSVPFSPGADDNASAMAALLACAGGLSLLDVPYPVCFAAFNREEERFRGSWDFVRTGLPENEITVAEAHIFEMVGYSGDQKVPAGLPIRLPKKGDFLGVLGNRRSNHLLRPLLTLAATYLPGFQVLGLQVYLGTERVFPVLKRSDHVPFWGVGLPALMWTDTAEFRNPNYHKRTDTPETLDYDFLRSVTRLAFLRILTFEPNR